MNYQQHTEQLNQFIEWSIGNPVRKRRIMAKFISNTDTKMLYSFYRVGHYSKKVALDLSSISYILNNWK